jgi:hypothetical protein
MNESSVLEGHLEGTIPDRIVSTTFRYFYPLSSRREYVLPRVLELLAVSYGDIMA